MSTFYTYHFDQRAIFQQVQQTGSFELTDSFGTLSLSHRQLDTGLSISIFNGSCNRPVELHAKESYHTDELTLFFNLGHCYECYMATQKQHFLVSPNQVIISSSMHSGGYTRTTCPKITGLNINLSLSLFRDMIEQDGRQELTKLFRPLLQDPKQSFFTMQNTTPSILAAANYLFSQPCNTPIETMKHKGLAWQVCAEVILSLVSIHRPVTSLRSADQCRIEQAREILAERYDTPPTLSALAREVGLNEFKLKAGFRDLYQQTPFGYLHQYRMQKAQELLRKQHGSIIQVANQVGYQNHGHFSSAFRKHFGLTPRDYLKLTG